MKNIAIKVKNRKQLNKATKILKKQGLNLQPRHNEQWIEDNISWAFEDDIAFIVVLTSRFGYHNHAAGEEIIKYKEFKKQNK